MYKLLGQKKDMTQVFSKDWDQVPVTLVDVNELFVVKKDDKKVWIGFGKDKKPKRADQKKYEGIKFVPKYVKEVSDESGSFGELKVGDKVSLNKLLDAEIEVTGVSKGKGFAGVHKRYDVKGGPESHGQKDNHRKIGSIGAQTPGRVFKGKKMPGHHGQYTTTIKNLKIVLVDDEERVIGIGGSVPGGRNAMLEIVVKKFGKSAEKADQPKKETKKEEGNDADQGENEADKRKPKQENSKKQNKKQNNKTEKK